MSPQSSQKQSLDTFSLIASQTFPLSIGLFSAYTLTMPKFPHGNRFSLSNYILFFVKTLYSNTTLTRLRYRFHFNCHNPTLAKCEDEIHTPKVGDLESFGTPENSELDYRGQNISYLIVLGIIQNFLKCRCPKWPHMSHLDICI